MGCRRNPAHKTGSGKPRASVDAEFLCCVLSIAQEGSVLMRLDPLRHIVHCRLGMFRCIYPSLSPLTYFMVSLCFTSVTSCSPRFPVSPHGRLVSIALARPRAPLMKMGFVFNGLQAVKFASVKLFSLPLIIQYDRNTSTGQTRCTITLK